ncbi:MAG TPA: glycosyltransferase [Chitinophagaceae bacterium]|nr:glycosyltransferase [Chitinophagaceae bacterium]
MIKPFISICNPTYKRIDLLQKLLDSIVSQGFKDYEVLINDNSPDDSVQTLVKQYTGSLLIQYEKNQPAVSAGANCVKVMQRATGEWVKIMHDDDWFSSDDALQIFADAARDSGKNFIFCASTQVWLDSDKKQVDELTPEKKEMLDRSPFCLFYLNVIGHPSVAMQRRDPAIQYDTKFQWVLDIDFYMRYLVKHPGYHYISQNLVNIGKCDSQESHKYYKNIRVELPEFFFLLSKYEPGLILKDIYAFHLVWNMLKRYKIKKVSQIYEAGYEGPMPDRIEEIIAFQKYIPRLIVKQTPWSKKLMKACFQKITRTSPDSTPQKAFE